MGRQLGPNLQLCTQLYMEYSSRKATRTSYEREKEQRVAGNLTGNLQTSKARNWTGVKKSASRFDNDKNHVRIYVGSDDNKELEIFLIYIYIFMGSRRAIYNNIAALTSNVIVYGKKIPRAGPCLRAIGTRARPYLPKLFSQGQKNKPRFRRYFAV